MARGVAVAVLNLFAVNAAHQPTTTCHLERKEERSDDWSRENSLIQRMPSEKAKYRCT